MGTQSVFADAGSDLVCQILEKQDMTVMNAPDRIIQLTETLDDNLDSYKKGIYGLTDEEISIVESGIS